MDISPGFARISTLCPEKDEIFLDDVSDTLHHLCQEQASSWSVTCVHDLPPHITILSLSTG